MKAELDSLKANMIVLEDDVVSLTLTNDELSVNIDLNLIFVYNNF